MTDPVFVRRGFVDVAHGQIHYRTAGCGAPLLMLHASPGSSKQLEGLIRNLASDVRVIAPDTPGNGDSDALPLDNPDIADLAAVLPAFLDALGIEQIDVYGSHTGAKVAAEFAILAPDRVRSLIFDGVQVLSDERRSEMMARYAHPFPADLEGGYLQRAFMFCRDQYIFFPWYERTVKGVLPVVALPDPQELHDWVVEVLKANTTYHLNYRAAFQWPVMERFPLVKKPVLIYASASDPLAESTRNIAATLPNGRYAPLSHANTPDHAAELKQLITGFLAAQI
ncbi:alpha/beta fold hydrolase [Sphingobium boeckii]|uniref:Pimeloyl-ACP methyl ester carboxylesterase n=1 Tax=Sphingobium boeckii TaxID=1082345 RepID=A0A7W9AIU9_9SPHN|nr:alpha/beta hydrolase [Sphingobium boeckii]MBB5686251.1 pimeloyl-ACP methyl ester carboxylesterase [Sphingobium boeckii]